MYFIFRSLFPDQGRSERTAALAKIIVHELFKGRWRVCATDAQTQGKPCGSCSSSCAGIENIPEVSCIHTNFQKTIVVHLYTRVVFGEVAKARGHVFCGLSRVGFARTRQNRDSCQNVPRPLFISSMRRVPHDVNIALHTYIPRAKNNNSVRRGLS